MDWPIDANLKNVDFELAPAWIGISESAVEEAAVGMDEMAEIRKEGAWERREGREAARRRGGGGRWRLDTRDAVLCVWSYGELRAGHKVYRRYFNWEFTSRPCTYSHLNQKARCRRIQGVQGVIR